MLTPIMTNRHTKHPPKKAAPLERPWTDNRDRARWIVFQLSRLGKSHKALAEEHGYSPSTFTNTASGMANANVEPIIAQALGVSPVWLFPEHYNGAGERIARVRGSNRTATGVLSKVEKAEAA
jgi:lambda repressor-like predicted transcriptional regulator